jgi:hypothetical protein
MDTQSTAHFLKTWAVDGKTPKSLPYIDRNLNPSMESSFGETEEERVIRSSLFSDG